jgi:hypothetical protein
MTVIFTNTFTGDDNGNANFSIRNVVAITGGAQGQIRATFAASSSGALSTSHCSIGIWSGTGPNTTATPTELTFGGASGFSISSGASITSDWINFGGFTASDRLVAIFDAGANGNFIDDSASTGNTNWFKAAATSCNVAAPTGFTSQANLVISLASIEVRAAPSSGGNLPLMGVG